MPTQKAVTLGIGATVALVLVVKVLHDSNYLKEKSPNLRSDSRDFEREQRIGGLFREQRNNVSRLLNAKQQKLGQMECEKLAGQKVATSDTGGWCENSSKENGGKHMTDQRLVPVLIEFLSGKFVGSFGDGPGRYKQLLKDSGKLKDYHAYDGAPFCEQTSEGRVQFLDLTLPQYGLPLYDWIISLEVAEHIPPQFERVYIDNIVRHAREGVILSWARPGQDGYSHVNNRPFEYIKPLMESLGFTYDESGSVKLRNAASFQWFQNNINIFRRTNINIDELQSQA